MSTYQLVTWKPEFTLYIEGELSKEEAAQIFATYIEQVIERNRTCAELGHTLTVESVPTPGLDAPCLYPAPQVAGGVVDALSLTYQAPDPEMTLLDEASDSIAEHIGASKPYPLVVQALASQVVEDYLVDHTTTRCWDKSLGDTLDKIDQEQSQEEIV